MCSNKRIPEVLEGLFALKIENSVCAMITPEVPRIPKKLGRIGNSGVEARRKKILLPATSVSLTNESNVIERTSRTILQVNFLFFNIFVSFLFKNFTIKFTI